MPTFDSILVWFRRDLRLFDHAALYHALKSARRVYAVFVFDTDILGTLKHRQDRRVEFILACVRELRQALLEAGGDLIILHGRPSTCIPALARQLQADAVFCNRDYESTAMQRDDTVRSALNALGIDMHTFKDQVIFEQDEILTQSGTPFSVYTPYKNAWLKKIDSFYLRPYPVDRYLSRLSKPAFHHPTPALQDLGFEPTDLDQLNWQAGMSGGQQLFHDFQARIAQYHAVRDFPARKGPSYLSTHLRFGTVSIRGLARFAYEIGGSGAQTWLSELIWRDFYFQILYHRPDLASGHTFRPEFETISFPNDRALFHAWCMGQTGYPLIDAAMRQLNRTGYMHNRLRMVTASFLAKDLLIDWRWGEAYFAEKLMDFDLAANNGGWQWAASTGCDAQPWFRIFNPVTQSEKFDPQGKFIRKYVPELARCNEKEIHAPWKMPEQRQQELGLIIGREYPAPVVDHALQRERALALYAAARP
jgi:deoxyribodipyrimidine photo-lyase